MLPTISDDPSPDFLTSALQQQLPDVRVHACRTESLTGERGIASALVRVHLEGEGAELPETLVMKRPPVDPGLRALLKDMWFFEREVCFYNTLASATPVQTPTCYFAESDPDTGDALLLLQDLDRIRAGDSVRGATVEEVTAVLLDLAGMHARWWENAAVCDHPWTPLPSMLAPAVLTEVFESGWPTFLSRLSTSTRTDLSTAKAWISSQLHEAATTLFESGPRTLVHNDVQGDNLFFVDGPEPSVVFIDWQLAAYGRGVIDVASAIRSLLEPGIRRDVEPRLVTLYHEELLAAGVQDYPVEQCRADYDLATVLAPARLATSVGLHPALRAHAGAPWNTLFPRLSEEPR